METAIWTLVGIAIGAVVTFCVSRHYYMAAAKDLEVETERLRNLMRIALTAMEQKGMVKLNRDSGGQIIGMEHVRNLSDAIGLTDSLSASSKPEPPPPPPEPPAPDCCPSPRATKNPVRRSGRGFEC
jgi:hypothetical protein